MTWDKEAATWDTEVAVRLYSEAAFASLEQATSQHGVPLEGASVCDFGCGTGLMTEKLAGRCARIDCVDSSTAMLEVLEAKGRRAGWAHVQTYTELPSVGEVYSLIVCSSVCAFVDDYPGTLARLARRLRPGGLLVQWDWELDPEAEEPFGLSEQGIRQGLSGAGLEVLSVGVGFSVPFEDRVMRPLMGVGKKPAA